MRSQPITTKKWHNLGLQQQIIGGRNFNCEKLCDIKDLDRRNVVGRGILEEEEPNFEEINACSIILVIFEEIETEEGRNVAAKPYDFDTIKRFVVK